MTIDFVTRPLQGGLIQQRLSALRQVSACSVRRVTELGQFPTGIVKTKWSAIDRMPYRWHTYAMARTRLSTTVDHDLLQQARSLKAGRADAELIDEALSALLASYRSAETDAAYAAAYTAHPIDEPDEWGDLATFREAASN